ncbi:VOC family protein [Zhouia spongiae]|uniref:VOC family protein n=1 Tax=Zhouia spongiae TaxID=2202721 RepID=A0ABY3YNS3_9FLAO|nr:VOC family protein [Zhouia spongiae]UNY99341.1 VOC family protein [Zhouia spongiae]
MKEANPVVWFEIYVHDLNRAVKFYEEVLKVELFDLNDPSDASVLMKGFPGNMEAYGASGALIKMKGMEPSGNNSTVVYFGCDDCAVLESRVSENGGKVQQPKMSIGEHGFVSLVVDSEGNTIGFHSLK